MSIDEPLLPLYNQVPAEITKVDLAEVSHITVPPEPFDLSGTFVDSTLEASQDFTQRLADRLKCGESRMHAIDNDTRATGANHLFELPLLPAEYHSPKTTIDLPSSRRDLTLDDPSSDRTNLIRQSYERFRQWTLPAEKLREPILAKLLPLPAVPPIDSAASLSAFPSCPRDLVRPRLNDRQARALAVFPLSIRGYRTEYDPSLVVQGLLATEQLDIAEDVLPWRRTTTENVVSQTLFEEDQPSSVRTLLPGSISMWPVEESSPDPSAHELVFEHVQVARAVDNGFTSLQMAGPGRSPTPATEKLLPPQDSPGVRPTDQDLQSVVAEDSRKRVSPHKEFDLEKRRKLNDDARSAIHVVSHERTMRDVGDEGGGNVLPAARRSAAPAAASEAPTDRSTMTWTVLPTLLQRPRLLSALKSSNEDVEFVERSTGPEVDADLCASFRAGVVLVGRKVGVDDIQRQIKRLVLRYQDLLVVLTTELDNDESLQRAVLATFERIKLRGQRLRLVRALKLDSQVRDISAFARQASQTHPTPGQLASDESTVRISVIGYRELDD